MHIALTVPIWALIAAGVPAWGAISVLMGRFITTHTKGRWPSFVTAGMSFFWPVTLAAGVVAFPAWLVIWLCSNYGEGVKSFLGKDLFARFHRPVAALQTPLQCGAVIELIRPAEEFPSLPIGSKGVVDQIDAQYGKVHCNWVYPDGRHQSGFVFRDRVRVIA